ncbi:AMP-binding protein [Amycolatopsis aidingensis]|uniref:AMP-binding protein n=1 Tax=Amycolatopsis aidingensis TaxID=2842453 RepID=UPI001C0AAC91|nr:AMP-binding protein [Amycolatopsis aidingensis]
MGTMFVLDRIRDIATHEPGRPALRADGRSIDYGELVTTATKLGDLLRDHGAGPEDVVATVLPRGSNSIIAILGIWMAGAAYLPTDAKWPGRRLDLALAESATHVLEEAADGEAEARMPDGKGLRVRRLRGNRGSSPNPGWDARNLAYVLHTSGSTGTPNAVGVEFGALDNYGRYLHDLARRPAVHPDGEMRVLLSANLCFDASLRPVLLLTAGATLVVAPDLTDGSWQDHIDCIRDNGITVISGVPSWYSGLLGAGYRPRESGVRLAFIGGEAVPGGVVRELTADGCTVVVQYGPTETTIAATGRILAGADFTEPPIGDPIPGARIHLYRNDSLVPAAEGEAGQLYVGGAGVARGYLRNPRLTAERFVPDPSGPPGSRMFRSGDLARMLPREGYGFLGRQDDQVKIGGYRIELGEVSSVANRHPAVAQSVAFVHREGAHPRLVACYVGSSGASEPGTEESVRDYLASELPEYLVPAVVRRLERLPVTDHGKVDVAALGEFVRHGHAEEQARPPGAHPDPAAIEAALTRHPAVAEAVTVVRAEAGDRRLVAYVVPGDGPGSCVPWPVPHRSASGGTATTPITR